MIRDYTRTSDVIGFPTSPAIKFSAQIRAISFRVCTVALAMCGAITQFGSLNSS
jgi:hypothetical protein